MQVQKVRWFNKVGIVQVKCDFEGIKYYIKEVDGFDEELDIMAVLNWGCHFPKSAGDVLFGVIA